MKIVLAYAYGASNAGDHALTLGALDLVATVAPTADVVVVSRFSRQVEPTRATEDIRASFPEVEIVPSPFSGSRETPLKRALEMISGGLLVSIALLFPTLVTKLESSNPAIHAIAESDIVLCNGGNLFYWNRHRKALGRLVALLFPALLARRLEIPYGFLPQSMGPFEGQLPRLLFRSVLEEAAFVWFREPLSVEHAGTVAKLLPDRQHVTLDLAFMSGNDWAGRSSTRNGSHSGRLAVTLRASDLGDPEVARPGTVDSDSTRKVASYMSEAISNLAIARGLGVTVVVQTDNDHGVSTRFIDECRAMGVEDIELTSERDPSELNRIYEQAVGLVGMRLHSLIFALRVGTPAMGVYLTRFGPKIEGTYRELGLSRWVLCLDQDSVTTANARVEEFLESLDPIREQVARSIERERDQARERLQAIIRRIRDGTMP